MDDNSLFAATFFLDVLFSIIISTGRQKRKARRRSNQDRSTSMAANSAESLIDARGETGAGDSRGQGVASSSSSSGSRHYLPPTSRKLHPVGIRKRAVRSGSASGGRLEGTFGICAEQARHDMLINRHIFRLLDVSDRIRGSK